VLTAPGDVPWAGVLRDGWAAWSVQAGGSTQVWTRSPAGEVRRADGGLAVGRWLLSSSGKVVLDDGTHVWFTAPPYTSRVVLGNSGWRFWLAWHNGQLYAFPGTAIFRIDR
jgi:hypothetical protein